MNEADIVLKTAKKMKKTKAETEKYFTTLLQVLHESLSNDEAVTLKGFGTFSVCKRAARKGKDPKTKKIVTLPACKTVRFTVGQELKDELNKNL